MLNPNAILTVPKSLYIDLAIDSKSNMYNEEVYLLYNPVGYGGVMTVGKQVVDMIKAFDGVKDIQTVISEMDFTPEEKEMANMIVRLLVEKQMLKAEGYVPNKDVWKKELTCWLHITNDCNLRCKYCYIHKSHCNMADGIVYESIDKMMDSCRKHNYESLCLMLVGGEPLMRFDLVKEIVSYCEENKGDLNVRFVLPTNGTLITPDVAKYIVSKQMSVGISIDGVEEYHDINRVKVDGSGSYKLAMKGIDNLIAEGLKPSIMVTVTKQNLDGLPALTKALIDKQIYFRFSFERDTQTGKPAILEDEKHCIDVLKQCFAIMEAAYNEGKMGWHFQFGDVSFTKPCRRGCAAGKNFFAIGQDGSIGSCSLGLECTKTNISEVNDVISDIENVFAEIGKTSACDVSECSTCLWRHSCAGACPLQTYATYKTYMHISPYCNVYKECLPDVIRIYAMAIYYNNKKGA